MKQPFIKSPIYRAVNDEMSQTNWAKIQVATQFYFQDCFFSGPADLSTKQKLVCLFSEMK